MKKIKNGIDLWKIVDPRPEDFDASVRAGERGPPASPVIQPWRLRV